MSIAEKTAEAKKNKDGLVAGGLVSPQDHTRVTREKKKAALKAIKDKAEKKTTTKPKPTTPKADETKSTDEVKAETTDKTDK